MKDEDYFMREQDIFKDKSYDKRVRLFLNMIKNRPVQSSIHWAEDQS